MIALLLRLPGQSRLAAAMPDASRPAHHHSTTQVGRRSFRALIRHCQRSCARRGSSRCSVQTAAGERAGRPAGLSANPAPLQQCRADDRECGASEQRLAPPLPPAGPDDCATGAYLSAKMVDAFRMTSQPAKRIFITPANRPGNATIRSFALGRWLSVYAISPWSVAIPGTSVNEPHRILAVRPLLTVRALAYPRNSSSASRALFACSIPPSSSERRLAS